LLSSGTLDDSAMLIAQSLGSSESTVILKQSASDSSIRRFAEEVIVGK
jgi:predicted PhzF superfamily epimerase YddE/YHI9